eukprot:SAG11_NODE_12455_length_702_cov_1.532338_2_plen_148_part_00
MHPNLLHPKLNDAVRWNGIRFGCWNPAKLTNCVAVATEKNASMISPICVMRLLIIGAYLGVLRHCWLIGVFQMTHWSFSDDSFSCACTAGWGSGVCAYNFIAEYNIECTDLENTICDIDVNECASSKLLLNGTARAAPILPVAPAGS